MKHNRWTRRIVVAAATLVVAALAVTMAAAAAGKTDPIAALKREIASLKAQNKKLYAESPAGIQRQLGALKAAASKYEDVKVAEADGYKAESPCEMLPVVAQQTSFGGAMGIHFINDALLRRPPNLTKPPILVYLPTAGGGFQLVAAEYFKPDADQNAHTDNDRPTLFGRAFDGPMAGHAPGMPMHYDLHIWLWKHNPSGLFAPWNPDASC